MKRRGAIAAAGAAALGIATWLAVGRAPAPAMPAPEVAAPAAAAGHPAPAPAPPARAVATPATADGVAVATTTTPTAALPLPPLDGPVAGILADLEKRALAGDARAACRLAAELSRCATLPRRREAASMFDPATMAGAANRPAQDREWQIDMAARMENAVERDATHCAGIEREQARQAPAWLHRAARAGHLPSMSAFAVGAWLDDPAIVHHPALVEAYRTEAPAMAEAALAAGDRGMLLALGSALTGAAMRSRLAEVVEPDPVRGHALLRLSVDLAPPSPARAPTVTPPPAPIRAQWRSDGAERMFAERRLARVEAALDPAQRAASAAIATEWRVRLDALPPQPPPDARVDPGQYLGAADCAR
ncbi:MAG: hypothetical protein ACK558_12565 [Pseudomonadota bacterium]